MRRTSGYFVAVGVGLLAVLAPAGLSVYFAWRQSLADEQQRVLASAQDVLRRAEEHNHELLRDTGSLQTAGFAPCSAAEVELMRELDLQSPYVQAVGRMQGDALVCSSMGDHPPIGVGPPELVAQDGTVLRMARQLSNVPGARLDVVQRGNFAVLSDERLIFDTPTEGKAVEIASIIPSARRVVSTTYKGITLQMVRLLPPGGTAAYVYGGRVVGVARSSRLDFEVAATAPGEYVRQRVWHFVLLQAPVSLLGAALLVWAVLRISRVYLSLPGVLKAAARRKEFFVEYQPVVNLETGRWVGAEALVRWNRAGQRVPPDQFIPVAEETGVVTAITREVMEIVGRDLPKLTAIDPEFRVGINLAAADLVTPQTLAMLDRILAQPGVRPENLKVEATERGFVRAEDARQVLEGLRARGVRIAIDDFGTGYSSLAYLQHLDVDTLKIDKTFVDTIGTDGVTSQVVLQIIHMAHELKLGLIAEGVETEEQAAFLRGRGVDRAQGWLFSRPIPCEELKRKLAERMTAV